MKSIKILKKGMTKIKKSVLAKAAFEETTAHLLNAAIFDEIEHKIYVYNKDIKIYQDRIIDYNINITKCKK